MDVLKTIGRGLEFILDSFTVVLYHAILIGAIVLGVVISSSSAGLGVGLIGAGILLMIVFWTTGWMLFLG